MPHVRISFGVMIVVLLAAGIRAGQIEVLSLDAAKIEAVLGSEPAARAVVRLVLGDALSNGKREFVLASQVRDAWLPSITGVELVRLADNEIDPHLRACGTYWVLWDLVRNGNVASLSLSGRCHATLRKYVVSFEGGMWRLGPPGSRGWVAGIGSGFSRRPIGCPCL